MEAEIFQQNEEYIKLVTRKDIASLEWEVNEQPIREAIQERVFSSLHVCSILLVSCQVKFLLGIPTKKRKIGYFRQLNMLKVPGFL